jgi:aminomethyltransferase
MVEFAGYNMPVQYPSGILNEHLWTRQHAGLFDVSHMGQAFLTGSRWESVALALETLVPADVLNLKPYQQRYSQLLNAQGGILDDVMITRAPHHDYEGCFYLVVNAGTKEADFAHLQKHLPSDVTLHIRDDLALLALQGPDAETVLSQYASDAATLSFMNASEITLNGIACHVSRSGYTGEDGFELSLPVDDVGHIWNMFLKDTRVKPIGLGARDSLRLEAGLCLYGHDIDTTTSPIEAQLTWSIQKRRRTEGGFLGAERVLSELANGTTRKRVGLTFEGRAPAREGAIITDEHGHEIGIVTSGGFAPSLNAPVAMGYVAAVFAAIGTPVHVMVRDKPLKATVSALPFVPNRFKR